MSEYQLNRRRSRRTAPNANLRVECRKGLSGLCSDLAVAVLDISETGIRLAVSEQLEQGHEVELLLAGTGLQKPMRRIGKVVWSANPENQTCVGIVFDKALSYADVQRFSR